MDGPAPRTVPASPSSATHSISIPSCNRNGSVVDDSHDTNVVSGVDDDNLL
jgi:hypothetical protein